MHKFKLSRFLLIASSLGLQGVIGVKAEGSYLSFNQPTFQPVNLSTFQTPTFFAKASTCPTDVEPLVSLLIRDLPSYANRVIQRSRRLSRADENYYVLIAGRPEFSPLTLGPGQYTPTPPSADVEPPQQVFITTLERQYQGGKAVSIQHYHWLFLVETPDGWRLAMMFSRFGSASAGRPPTAPRESSNGVIGQAVNLWLRDCRAGAIRSSENRNT